MVIQGTVLGSYRQGGTGGGQSGNGSVTGAGHFVVLIPHLARCEVCRITAELTGGAKTAAVTSGMFAVRSNV